jgi:peptide subunit release factor 1 (eRF1)
LRQRLDVDSEEYTRFLANAEQVTRFVAEHRPAERGIVIFSDKDGGLFWFRGLNIPLRSTAHWEQSIFVQPLLEALDEYELYAVALIDHNCARLFTVHLGEIREHGEISVNAEMHRTKTAGTDHWRSQTRFQHKVEEHLRWHVRQVAEAISQLETTSGFDRLLLAGPTEVRSLLYEKLPARLRRKVIGCISLPMETSKEQILSASLEIERAVEREDELRLVDRLLTAAAKGKRAVIGLEGVLSALQEGRMRRLVYAEGYVPAGNLRAQYGTLALRARESSHGNVVAADNLMDPVVDLVVAADGDVEAVQGEAASLLNERAGGIGAFLWF